MNNEAIHASELIANGPILLYKRTEEFHTGRWGRTMTALDLFPDGDRTLRLVGEIDLMTAPELEAALLPLADAGGTVLLDMRGVLFMDSTGIRAILSAERRLKGRGTLVLRDPQPVVVRLLGVTGLYPPLADLALEVRFEALPGEIPGAD